MTTTSKPLNGVIKLAQYKAEDYAITLTTNWYGKKINDHRTAFYGPKVGNSRICFYVTSMSKTNKKNYLDVSKMVKDIQKEKEKYRILEEKDISRNQLNAFMRRSCWYHSEMDMTLFIREIFTENTEKVFVLSTSIPNAPNLEELDTAILQMMNSFRFI